MNTTEAVKQHLMLSNLLRTTVNDVAKALHLSPTTLRRRMADEGTNYISLLDQVRKTRLNRMMGQRAVNGVDVHLILGFSRVNSFRYAFRGWTGHNFTKHEGQVA